MFDLPITIVAGYLGSGKTTYINQRLNNPQGIRYGVLVNDFGSLNIDAELIEASDGVSVALENGCVCCSLEGGMEQAADKLRSISSDIDWVLLEASGVADPTRLRDRVLSWPGFDLKETLTLVDATRIRKLTQDKFVGAHMKKQLNEAEKLFITKRDLISADQISDLELWLKKQQVHSGSASGGELEPPPQFVSERIEFAEPQTRQVFEDWLDSQHEGTLRLKGFVHFHDQPDDWELIQWVDQVWSITPHISRQPIQPGLIKISAAPQPD